MFNYPKLYLRKPRVWAFTKEKQTFLLSGGPAFKPHSYLGYTHMVPSVQEIGLHFIFTFPLGVEH
jgi:hypothetical protein